MVRLRTTLLLPAFSPPLFLSLIQADLHTKLRLIELRDQLMTRLEETLVAQCERRMAMSERQCTWAPFPCLDCSLDKGAGFDDLAVIHVEVGVPQTTPSSFLRGARTFHLAGGHYNFFFKPNTPPPSP